MQPVPEKPKTAKEIEDELEASISLKFLEEYKELCFKYKRSIAIKQPVIQPEVIKVEFFKNLANDGE